MVSKESGHIVERLSEPNYLFRLSEFKEKLKEYLNGNVLIPNNQYKQSLFDQLNEVNDLSVSRDAKRVSWGIRVISNLFEIQINTIILLKGTK